MVTVFAFRSGRSVRGADAQKVGEWLEHLRAESGALTPDAVVEAARDPASPGHPAFEWDDTAAAHQHRLVQARRLIVSVRVLNGPVQVPVPAFVSVRTPEAGRAYLPTVEAMSDEQIRARVLSECRQFVESLERRYRHFSEAADVLAGLRKAVG